MKALLCDAFGPIESLRLAETPDPVAAAGQVVVEVKACALNFPDALMVQGLYQVKPPLPFSPGAEFAGVIASVGEGVAGWRPGDAVISFAGYGGLAQRCVVDARRLMPLPSGMSFLQGAAFLLTYGTALQAWFWGGPTGLPTPYAIEQTADGGRTWTPGALHCPVAGPCLLFGPAPTWTWPGVCNGQALLWSGDGGRTWRLPVWPQQVCYVGTGPGGPYQIAAIGPRSALLLGGWNYPARLTVDGGRTWRDIALPPLPGMKSGGLYEPPYLGLHMQPDGSLAALQGGTWWVLPVRARLWCATGLRLPASGVPHPGALRCARAS